MADASWGISRTTGEKEADDLVFTRQMAALYNKDAYDGKERVLEICYTDLKHTYQIKLDDKGSEVLTDQSLAATTRIDTFYGMVGYFPRRDRWRRGFGKADVYGDR